MRASLTEHVTKRPKLYSLNLFPGIDLVTKVIAKVGNGFNRKISGRIYEMYSI